MFDLERFIKAQDSDKAYDGALREIRKGCKQTHWIWFVFPQLRGLGHSSMAEYYGISSLLEAKAFLCNVTLRSRLEEISKALLKHEWKEAATVFGELDAMKVRSCMTLFDIVEPETLWRRVLDQFFAGQRCQLTLDLADMQTAGLENPFRKDHEHMIPIEHFFDSDSNYSITGRAVHLFKYALAGESAEAILCSYLWKNGMDSHTLNSAAECLTYYLRDYYSRAAFRYANGQLADKYHRIVSELIVLDPLTMARSFDKAVSEIKNDQKAMLALNRYIDAY